MSHLSHILEILPLFCFVFFFNLHFDPHGQKLNSTSFVFCENSIYLFYRPLAVAGVNRVRNSLKGPKNQRCVLTYYCMQLILYKTTPLIRFFLMTILFLGEITKISK